MEKLELIRCTLKVHVVSKQVGLLNPSRVAEGINHPCIRTVNVSPVAVATRLGEKGSRPLCLDAFHVVNSLPLEHFLKFNANLKATWPVCHPNNVWLNQVWGTKKRPEF